MSFLPLVRLLVARSPSASLHQLRHVICQQSAASGCRALSILSLRHQTSLSFNRNTFPATPICVQQVRSYAKKAKKEKKEKKEKGGKSGKVSKPKVTLTNAELNEVISYDKMCHQMELVVDNLKSDFIEQLTVRTNTGALNHLAVDTPDGQFPLIQLAQIAQKSPPLVVINMAVSPQYIPAVKTALAESGMNLNPQQDGTTIFVPLPKVTKEHRENLAKNAKVLCTKSKDKLRDIHNTFLRDLKKKKDAHSTDLIHNVQEYIDQKTKEYAAQAESLMETKQKELLQEK